MNKEREKEGTKTRIESKSLAIRKKYIKFST